MDSTQASSSNPSKKIKLTIIPPRQLFVNISSNEDDTTTLSPITKSSSPSPPNVPSKTPSTKDTSSTFGTTCSLFESKLQTLPPSSNDTPYPQPCNPFLDNIMDAPPRPLLGINGRHIIDSIIESYSGRSLALLCVIDIVVSGNAPVAVASAGANGEVPPKTAKELQQRKNELKAKTIKNRFGGNKESKKMQKVVLKQQFESFTTSRGESLDRIYDSFQKLVSQLEIHEEKINPDDLKEIDIKWQVVILTMRVKKFMKKTRRNFKYNGKESVGFNNSKVECYNYYKKGHFARECKAPRSQEYRNRNNANSPSNNANVQRNAPADTTNSTALIVQDRVGRYDWSFQAEEASINFALIAYSSPSSSSSSDSGTVLFTCSKECLKSFETLQKQYDEPKEKLNRASLEIISYQIGLESVEARLLVHEKNEAAYEESIEFLKYDVRVRDAEIKQLKNQLDEVLKEKDDLKLKLQKFETSSKNLTKLINSQISVNDKTGLGYDSQLNESELNNSPMNIIMSDSEDSTVTYTAVSNPFGGLSYIRSSGVDWDAVMQEDPFAYVSCYPKFMPPEDEILLVEEQPLPAIVSSTTDSPGYVPESDPEEDLEKEDDEDPEEDPADYPANGGDEGDDEDESSDDDEDDEVNIEVDDDEEEEEHPAPADSTTVALPTVDQAPSAEETEPFETDESAAIPPPHPAYRVTARISIPAPAPTPVWSDTEIPSPPLPPILSPLPVSPPLPVSSPPPASPIRSLGYRAMMIRLRAEAASTSHSLLLPPLLPIPAPTSSLLFLLPSTNRREDRPKVTLLPRKRLGIALGPRYEIRRDPEREVGYGITNTWDDMVKDIQGTPVVTDVSKLSQRMKDFVTTVRQDTYEIYRRDRRAHARIALLMEREARMSQEAWGRSMNASNTARAKVMSLRTTVLAQQLVITKLQAADHRRQAVITETLAADRKRQA
ncbi:ribonuclease H-like domain-containing protein [Tanacetum coccineum]